jgi:hypothetical protein
MATTAMATAAVATGLVFAVPASAAATVPGKPTNVVVVAVGPADFQVTWSPPADDGGSPVTGYGLYTGYPLSETPRMVVGATTNSVVLRNLVSLDDMAVIFVRAWNEIGASYEVAVSDVLSPEPKARIVPIEPVRILDTRNGPKPASSVLAVPTAGFIPADAVGVVANVTAVDTESEGFLSATSCAYTVLPSSPLTTAHPSSGPASSGPASTSSSLPLVSEMSTSIANFMQGETVAGSAWLAVHPELTSYSPHATDICVASSVTAHLLVDIVAYVQPGNAFFPGGPYRQVDTRRPIFERGLNTFGDGRLRPSETLNLPSGESYGNASNKATVVTVTAVSPSDDGFITIAACGQTLGVTSSLNFVKNVTTANTVVIGSGSCITTSATTHVLIDVWGVVPGGQSLTTVPTTRLIDTRSAAKPGTGTVTTVAVTGPGRAQRNAEMVSVNITIDQAAEDGYVTAFACGGPVPNTSTVNVAAGKTRANGALVRVGTGGTICLKSSVAAHLIVDLNGYSVVGRPLLLLGPQTSCSRKTTYQLYPGSDPVPTIVVGGTRPYTFTAIGLDPSFAMSTTGAISRTTAAEGTSDEFALRVIDASGLVDESIAAASYNISCGFIVD